MKHKNIHVVYIITKLELGGAQKVCLSLFNAFNKTDNATLISGTAGRLSETIKNNKNVFLIGNLIREVTFFSVFNEIVCFFKLISILRKLKAQHTNIIVHTHSTKAGLIGRWAAFFARIKTRIHTIHGFAFHNHQNAIKWWLIYCAELFTSFITSHFICVSSYDVKMGIKLFPFFKGKHSIIRAAVDEHFFIPAKKINNFPEHTPFIFGTVACFKPQKNIFDLLRAFAFVYEKNKNTRLEIIGDGILRNKIETWIQQHNLNLVITLHGWQKDVKKKMIHWHVFALTSLWEGLPCAIVEARLLKLPVISYDTGGITDIIEHDKNGLIYPQKEWQKLAQGMLLLSKNKALYKKLHLQEMLTDFSKKQMIIAHTSLYSLPFLNH